MRTQLNANGRLVVLVGALVLTVLAAVLMLMMKQRHHMASPAVSQIPHKTRVHKRVAHTAPAAKSVHHVARHRAAARPKPARRPVRHARAATPVLASDGLPKLPPAIARPLAAGKVVVV